MPCLLSLEMIALTVTMNNPGALGVRTRMRGIRKDERQMSCSEISETKSFKMMHTKYYGTNTQVFTDGI